ncbi:MAG: hypothetical protein J6A37_01135 [Oscillospiraceae bacterium]|nr:hypothetical protein [Oscillospiraceae bacterium]
MNETINSTQVQSSEDSTVVILLKAVLGAVVGAIPGMILWAVLSKIGIVAALAGFLMFMGQLIACDRFTQKSKQMNIPVALIICAVVFLGDIYLCERFVWAWEISSAFAENGLEASVFSCFCDFGAFTELTGVQEQFTHSLVTSYLYAILGAAAGAAKLFKR